MAQIVKLKRSSVAKKVPTASDLELGELAMNTVDGKVYFEKNDGSPSVQTILTTDSQTTGSVDLTGAVTASYFQGNGAGITGLTSAAIDSVAGMTNNYVLTATGASAITGESNLQFDGTALAVTGPVTASYFKGDGSALTNVEDPNAVVFSIVFGG